MTPRDYTCSIQAPVSAKEAYGEIARVSEWWAEDFEDSARKLGDTFTVRFGETFVDFQTSEAVLDRKIVWEVAACNLPWLQDKTEWNSTSVAWDVPPSDGTTTVTITHRGLVPGVECYSACEQSWNGYAQTSLVQFLNGGNGMLE